MAGDGMRFGGTFKPFLDATEKKFIELAKEPFDTLSKTLSITYYFIYRQDQELEFKVEYILRKLFPNDKIHCCIIPDKTSGPLETIQKAVEMYELSGYSFVCDCDHSIPLTSFISLLNENAPRVIIPTWKYKPDEFFSWSKVKLDHNGVPISFHEKEDIPFSSDYKVEGMIGCYAFRDIRDTITHTSMKNMSELFNEWKDKEDSFKCVNVPHAEFFGTPEQLITFRFNRARKYTFFIDIDGTLLHLPKHVPYESKDTTLLPGAITKIQEWKSQGHTIVLTTGRVTERREKLITQLHELGIPYDQLVTGLASGPRIVINDKKPYCPFHPMSQAIQLHRNEGIEHVRVVDTPAIIQTLRGGSFALVYLIDKDGKQVVRKYIEKRPELTIHYETLKRQYEDMKRMNYLSPNIYPTIYSMYESPDEYYIDMEYLKDYVELLQLPNDIRISTLNKLIPRMFNDVYVFKKYVNGPEWMNEFITEKIKSKYDFISSLSPIMHSLVNDDYVFIQGRSVKGLKHFINSTDLTYAEPEYVCPIHGDLTLENIMVHPSGCYKLIDPSGSRYVDAIEMEIAKLFQHLVAQYEEWDSYHPTIIDGSFYTTFRTYDPDTISWISHMNKDTSKYIKKGIFFLCMYFIRMIPFLIKSSSDKALHGLLYALYHLQVS